MVGDVGVQVVTQEPEPVQALGECVHQLTLGADVVEDEKEHQLEDHRRRNGDVAVAAILVLDLVVDEVEVDNLTNPAQRMVAPDPLFKIQPQEKQVMQHPRKGLPRAAASQGRT